jgi:hypothetical protein
MLMTRMTAIKDHMYQGRQIRAGQTYDARTEDVEKLKQDGSAYPADKPVEPMPGKAEKEED